MNQGECEKNNFREKVHILFQKMQLLESSILQKSEILDNATVAVDSYHNKITNHINEVSFVVTKYNILFLGIKYYI